ncbi:hypothetical protein K488DRAFT_77869 [Vararia minispora EC-137]|uniref:Uncharacterized protein n=1 Tax=Vararia minispora EC-137 TaxID=1314806 RepID=A0ACB8QPA4_9AGAM|nr:hypothetical protein K488DRAFT_77869 [Vararia minispora EC-137]
MSPSLTPPLSPSSPPPAIDTLQLTIPESHIAEPPPPYPSSPRRARRTRRHHHSDTDHDHRRAWSDSGDDEPNERMPLLGHIPGRPQGGLRPRALSQSSATPSAVSGTPSLAQALRLDLDSDIEDDTERYERETEAQTGRDAFEREEDGLAPTAARRRRSRVWAYFKPLARRAEWAALFHLFVLNFPYALLAAIFCFVFTLVGTTLLVALPLGAVVCFFDLLGARALARGEVMLQTAFHGPLGYELVAPLPPIFTRTRVATAAEAEVGATGLRHERSFYRNSYAMFTDPTSYHALFYFIVIKPSITLLLSLFLLIVVPLSFALIIPAPATLRLVRRLGIWQANIAVEGLYMGGTG